MSARRGTPTPHPAPLAAAVGGRRAARPHTPLHTPLPHTTAPPPRPPPRPACPSLSAWLAHVSFEREAERGKAWSQTRRDKRPPPSPPRPPTSLTPSLLSSIPSVLPTRPPPRHRARPGHRPGLVVDHDGRRRPGGCHDPSPHPYAHDARRRPPRPLQAAQDGRRRHRLDRHLELHGMHREDRAGF